jgi:multiple sugar transport system ATP-binding protein
LTVATVDFQKVTKRYPDGTVGLKDFNLKIRDGEFVVLVGPSGCGKSTALRLLAGLEDVTEGKILIDGKVVNTHSPQQRNIAMVFQNYALYPHMTVRQNLDFPLKMKQIGTKERAEKIAEISTMLNLTEQLDRKPTQLSGGQRQRVAMGRALVRNPSVFLLDEPLSNLDAKQRAQIRSEIALLQNKLGKTTLYVTHDQIEAMTLGDRVAVLEGGKLHQIGTPFELYVNPSSTFVAQFIGSPGMNILPATMTVDDIGQTRVKFGDHEVLLREKKPQETSSLALPEIQLGFRPESVHTVPFPGCIELSAEAITTEFLGHETLIYFHLDGMGRSQQLIARRAGRLDFADRKMPLFFSPDDLFCFDKNGKAINLIKS